MPSDTIRPGLKQERLTIRINEALSDEVQAINAIYGEGTLQVTSIHNTKTRMRLTLPATIYDGDESVFNEESRKRSMQRRRLSTVDVAFWIEFPLDYPYSKPLVSDADVALHEYQSKSLWKIQLMLFSVLETIFVP